MPKKQLKLIRVTSVLSWIDSYWMQFWWRKVGFEAADKIGEESANFGTSVHKRIEDILKGKVLVDVESENPVDKCALEVLFWLEANNVKPLFETYNKSLEIEVKNEKLGLIGHFDYAASVNGEPCIIDFKTSNKMRKSFPLQKAAYAKMANKQLKVKINKGITIRSHWNKENKRVDFETKEYNDLGYYWIKFKQCLDLYKYFNRKENEN